MSELPMFPLGTVLLPGMVLPLHVFEPRYRAMVRHCLDGEPEFGVVLIERGSEVGGGDVRTGIGTVARILEVAELPDGRFALGTVGTRRVRIREWLDDDPWPRADVEELADDPGVGPESGDRWREAQAALRQVLALATELGEAVTPIAIELTDDPALGGFHAAALAPFGPVDRQRVLATSGVDERLEVLITLLHEHREVLEARLGI